MWYALICEAAVLKTVGENRHDYYNVFDPVKSQTCWCLNYYEPCSALLAKTNSCVLGQHLLSIPVVYTSGDKIILLINVSITVHVHTVATCVCPWLTVTVCSMK